MNMQFEASREEAVAQIQSIFDRQRQVYLAAPYPDRETRIEDLKKLSQMLTDHQDEIVQAISDDFGNRSATETLFCEFFVVLDGIKDTIKQLRKWMKPQKRHVQFTLYPGASNRLIPQPLGVVGVIVPWNFPANLTFAPLTSIFAAGNRAMVKMSDRSSRLADLLGRISGDYFPPEKLSIFSDNHQIGPDFSALPFDHLLFTGSTQTGKSVMNNASANLTPVTLELGGKSPAVVAPDFPLDVAAERIMYWKLLNAGQICTTVDYLFLPEDKVDAFVDQSRKLVADRYPDLLSKDYTSIIDDTAYQRLWETIRDAEAKGAKVICLSSDSEGDSKLRKIPPHLILNATDEMQVMQREIFGPILPIKTYREASEVVGYVNRHARPLALYPFTKDKALQDFYITHIISGGVTVNNCLLHVGQHDLPFGGVGHSGMGHYHGYEGFVNFSKMRPVFYQGFLDGMKPLMPPYTATTKKILNFMLRLAR
ncbi:coniferyl aldehyde dehydrogenase [Microbulbifer litoralis]|uniref:coniferyl aldehyde dehydrogenase n=1 Tax=Microbulbifer litoralis TaxID=2933965 RepID=UPI0020282BDA|nr:coniferyl aldehyde dehydrogenase [Microbulbifer sp. GX H0434]